MPRLSQRVCSALFGLVVLGLIGTGSGCGHPAPSLNPTAATGKGLPAALVQEPEQDDEAAEEARARWLADARAAKRGQLERIADAAEAKAKAAREAQRKGYQNNLAYAKQQVLKKEADARELDAKTARAAVATADTYEPPPPADQAPVVTVGKAPHGNDRVVHVQGYTRKDGTYVPPYTRRLPR